MNFFSKYLLFFLCWTSSCVFSQGDKIDSLRWLAHIAEADTKKVNRLNELTRAFYQQGVYDSGIIYSRQGLELATELNFKKGIARAFSNVGTGYYFQGNYSEALKNYFSALRTRDGINDPGGLAGLYNNIGNIYNLQENYAEALKYYLQARDIKRKEYDTLDARYANVVNNIGVTYSDLGSYRQALPFFREVMEIGKRLNDPTVVCNYHINTGNVYYRLAKTEKKTDLAHYAAALEHYSSALKIAEEINHPRIVAIACGNVAAVNMHLKNYPDAYALLGRSLKISREIGEKDIIKTQYGILAELDSLTGNYKGAYANYKLHIAYRDSLQNEENTESTVRTQMNYEFEKKESIVRAEQEKKDAVAAAESRMQRLLIYLVSAAALGAILVAFNIFRGYRQKQRANRMLEEKNVEIEKQKKIVEEKNKDITDSINYAQRIQQAILIPEDEIRKHFADAFVLMKPKDIVSGDFYWFAESKLNKVLAVADCTGHGVPGAFMSMLGFEMLQTTLLLEDVKTTAEAFASLDNDITETLNRNDRSHRDGMDMVLCAFSKSSNHLQFSCANRPLILVRKGELNEFSPDKYTIGGAIDNVSKNFRKQEIETEKGDMIYLFSDGYADQFGGAEGKKYMYRRFRELLVSVHDKPLDVQKQILVETFESWKTDLEQVDDVLVIGIRV